MLPEAGNFTSPSTR